MAIRFVDVKPGEGGGAEPAAHRGGRARDAAPPRPGPVVQTLPAEGELSASEPGAGDAAPDEAAEAGSPLPVLPHAKPEPKPRGRRKPMAAVASEKTVKAPDASSAPLLEGLLPELQAHAKPIPKPRGRKKAFG